MPSYSMRDTRTPRSSWRSNAEVAPFRSPVLAPLFALVAACSSGTTTTIPDDVSQDAVACDLSISVQNISAKVNATSVSSWRCTASTRTLTGNGIPDHPVEGGSFATPISAQNIVVSMRLAPVNTGTASGNVVTPGYALNSVKFDPATAGSCRSDATGIERGAGCVAAMGQDPWRLEAIGGAFLFGTDENNAHVQPNGQYHYHGLPEDYLTRLGKGAALTLVGFAVDGFPMYARYGYETAGSSASAIRVMRPSYRLKASPDSGRPSVTVFPMGTFTQDYEYVAGSGDLDECNGRTGVTPEFPGGTYHYYITETYPFVQRCVKGAIGAGT